MALIGAVYFLPDGSSSNGLSKLNQYERMHIQWSMTLTDMKLTEYMVFTEKSATADPFI